MRHHLTLWEQLFIILGYIFVVPMLILGAIAFVILYMFVIFPLLWMYYKFTITDFRKINKWH